MALNVIIDPQTDETFYDSVRRLLGGLDEEELPNEDIADPVVFDISEMEIMELVPCSEDFENLTSAEKSRVRLAMIYLLASKLCPSMANRIEYEVKTIDVSWKKKPTNFNELGEQLSSNVALILEKVSCYQDGEGSDSDILRIAPSKRAVKKREEL